MGCSLLHIEKKEKGLDVLVTGLTDPTSCLVTPTNLLERIDSALEQLETDDTIEPGDTDALVEHLLEARELFLDHRQPWNALDEMIRAYSVARSRGTLEEVWSKRAGEFTPEELRTETWVHFERACQMVERGDGKVLIRWVDKKVKEVRAVWSDYSRLPVSAGEITMESEMCHRFLKHGTECWVKALLGLRAKILVGGSCDNVLKCAEEGQRLLLAVQKFEAEQRTAERKYFVHYN